MSDKSSFSEVSQRVGVVMGGPSREREVSLRSGNAVVRGLTEYGYDVTKIQLESTDFVLPADIDAVFIALHGRFGEDGGVQRLLSDQRMPYTGADPAASRLALDKIATKRKLEGMGLPTPAYEVAGRKSSFSSLAFGLPIILKPRWEGSSIGLHKVVQAEQWDAALADALKYDAEILVEAFIAGRELTVGIVGEQILPIVEILAPEDCFDFKAKYTKGITDYLVPAPLEPEQTRACQQVALRTFHALGCRGVGRVDLRMDLSGDLYVLELNTIPGFTETSLLPMAAASMGIGFPELCHRVMETSQC